MGICRRELLDHVIALNERRLKRLLSEYVSYSSGPYASWTGGRERRGGELAARFLVVFLPSIESKGCIAAMIELSKGEIFFRPYTCVWDR